MKPKTFWHIAVARILAPNEHRERLRCRVVRVRFGLEDGTCILSSLARLVLLVALPLRAQLPAPATSYVVRGVVFDSVAGAPLAGAVVHVALRDALGLPFTATTDSAGQFRIAGLPSGQFLIDFNHDVLGALGLEAPLRAFTLSADTLVTVDIGIPSGAVVRALRCGRGAAVAREGMLAGFVRGAGGDSAFTGATVTVEWRAIALDPGNYHTVVQRARTAVGADGSYSLCGLPTDAPLALRVSAPSYHQISGHILVPDEGVARQDVRLADSATMNGAARVRGRVVHENGKPVMTGRAVLASLSRDVSVNNGDFLLTDLPPGTWAVEVRSIGLEPRSVLVEVTAGEIVTATITLDNRMQQLAAVTVIGRASRDSRILDEIMRRKNSSSGTTFLPGSIWLQNALHPADVLRAARGFTYRGPTEIYGRPLGKEGPCPRIAVYVDGAYFPQGFEGLDNAVAVGEVLAIEAYPDLDFAPIQWRINHQMVESPGTIGKTVKVRDIPKGPCAVVAVWTKH